MKQRVFGMPLINRYKKILIIFLLLPLLSLSACNNKLLNHELESITDEYKVALQQLCDNYGLSDAEIEMGTLSEYKNGNDYHYKGTVSVISSEFSSLSGESAFSFMKEFEQLENGMFDYKNVNISFTAHVDSGSKEYTYDSASSNNNILEYLMCYNKSAVTYKNGKLVYNVFIESPPPTTYTNQSPSQSSRQPSASSSHKRTNCGNPATHNELADIGEYYCDDCWEDMEGFLNIILGE